MQPRCALSTLAARAAILAAALTGGWSAAAQSFQFTVDPAASGLDATLTAEIATSGALIGNWDPVDNPTGTRTKPGLFGSFGETENVPVPVQVTPRVNGVFNTSTTGAFALLVDVPAGTVALSNFAADYLASGPVTLPINVLFSFASFRTRNPSSTYLGIPLTVPLGDTTLAALTATQIGPAAPGTLTEIEPGRYSFTVAPLVSLDAVIEVFGTPYPLAGVPAPLLLEGELQITGNVAVLTSVQPVDIANGSQPNQAIPQFPFDLPTVLPPGDVAHVLFDLTVTEISSSLAGTSTLRATGAAIPPHCPGDVNGDRIVNQADLGYLLANWQLAVPPNTGGDFNGDGVVNQADMSVLLTNWGEICP